MLLVNFYAQFNNIVSVLGNRNREISAVQLMKRYCLSSLLYACEISSMVHVILIQQRRHIMTLSEGSLIVAGEKNSRFLQFHTNSMPSLNNVDQR